MRLAERVRAALPRRKPPGIPESRLATARLVLRPLTALDADAVVALAGDWQVARVLGDVPHPLTHEAALAWIARGPDELALAIERDGAVIGAVTTFPSGPRSAEIGFWLGCDHWGEGYAREAAAAVIADGFAGHALAAFTSGHFADNPGSGRVLAACGFLAAGHVDVWCEARQTRVPSLRYRLERDDWAKRAAT
jgi:RimJ/RimL family protein N-acetyltransferase